MTIRCVLCPATEPSPLAALAHDWTSYTIDRPVIWRLSVGVPLLVAAAGEHSACAVCAEWLTDHRDRMLPPTVLALLDDLLAAADPPPDRVRQYRMELVGMARHLAEALTAQTPPPPGPPPQGGAARGTRRGGLHVSPQLDDFARDSDE
ncbi:hypothetical protein [Verrucosispora sp. NA02020]|uniref:hypothetical protein n=1 Tax=Verrucosispora sp. NA02020 TaxID=2742132 RepID=UPI003D730F07